MATGDLCIPGYNGHKNTKTAGGNRKKNQFLMVTKPSKNWSYNNQFVVTNANINDKIYPII